MSSDDVLTQAAQLVEAFCDALPGTDPTDYRNPGAETPRDPAWELFCAASNVYDELIDAAEDRSSIKPEVVEAATAMVDKAREIASLPMQTASCHVFECRNDRTADSPYCPAHTQITELLAAAPPPPVDRDGLIEIVATNQLRRYDEEFDASHLSWRDFESSAAEDVDALISAGVVAQPPAWWKGQEIEWNSTGDIWQSGVIIADLVPVVALIKLHDNGQRLNVETRHLRARDSSREAGQP